MSIYAYYADALVADFLTKGEPQVLYSHEFVTALCEGRETFPNHRQSANWTCVGICAHESAKQGGAIVRLPEFT